MITTITPFSLYFSSWSYLLDLILVAFISSHVPLSFSIDAHDAYGLVNEGDRLFEKEQLSN